MSVSASYCYSPAESPCSLLTSLPSTVLPHHSLSEPLDDKALDVLLWSEKLMPHSLPPFVCKTLSDEFLSCTPRFHYSRDLSKIFFLFFLIALSLPRPQARSGSSRLIHVSMCLSSETERKGLLMDHLPNFHTFKPVRHSQPNRGQAHERRALSICQGMKEWINFNSHNLNLLPQCFLLHTQTGSWQA